MGGFLQLHLPSKPARVVNDVTGALFVSPRRVIYTVSPIYGRPGLFVFDCASRRVRRLVGPRTFHRTSPEGADYFELAGQKDDRIFFYYVADVDRFDFARLHEPDRLYFTDLSGSPMRRSE